MTHPTEICFLFHVGLEKFAVGPITHGTKCHFAFHAKCRRYIDPDAPEEDQITDADVQVSGKDDDNPTGP